MEYASVPSTLLFGGLSVAVVLALYAILSMVRCNGPLRFLRHWWRNELAREIDVDEPMEMYFEMEDYPGRPRSI